MLCTNVKCVRNVFIFLILIYRPICNLHIIKKVMYLWIEFEHYSFVAKSFNQFNKLT